MELNAIISSILGLSKPWLVTSVMFSNDDKRLDVKVEYNQNQQVACPRCGTKVPPQGSENSTWRHDNLLDYRTYLHVRLPRIDCCKGVSSILPPWVNQNPRFVKIQEPIAFGA